MVVKYLAHLRTGPTSEWTIAFDLSQLSGHPSIGDEPFKRLQIDFQLRQAHLKGAQI